MLSVPNLGFLYSALYAPTETDPIRYRSSNTKNTDHEAERPHNSKGSILGYWHELIPGSGVEHLELMGGEHVVLLFG